MPPLESVAALTLALVPLSMVNATVTTILTSSALFAPVRALLARLSKALGEAAECDLCIGTWVGAAIAAAAVWWVGWTGADALLGGLVVTFATVAGATFVKEKANLW